MKTPVTTTIVSAFDLDARLAKAQERVEADNILKNAQQVADEREKRAMQDIARRRSLMQSAAQRDIKKDMDETRRKATVIAVNEVLGSAANVHRKFDALTPWIENLVEQSVRAILGTMPDQAVLKQIVTHAISQSRRELKYVLRTAPDVYEEAVQLVAELEKTEYRGLILDVEIDQDLSPQSILLTSSNGALDISLETQLDAVRKELERVLAP